MAKVGAGVLDAYVCSYLFGAEAKKTGSSVMAIIPWLKMMTCLDLVGDACVAWVFSQDLGIMAQSSEDLRVLLVVIGYSLLF